MHQELAPLARQLESELDAKMDLAGAVHDRLQAHASDWRRRALAAERRTNLPLEHPRVVLDITKRWNPALGTLMEYLEHRMRQELGEQKTPAPAAPRSRLDTGIKLEIRKMKEDFSYSRGQYAEVKKLGNR